MIPSVATLSGFSPPRLRIPGPNGTVLMQLGSWDSTKGLQVACKLPGTKQEVGESVPWQQTRSVGFQVCNWLEKLGYIQTTR